MMTRKQQVRHGSEHTCMEVAAVEPGSAAERLLSYFDDLDGALDASIDHDVNAQVSAIAQRLMSACRSPITSSCCSKCVPT